MIPPIDGRFEGETVIICPCPDSSSSSSQSLCGFAIWSWTFIGGGIWLLLDDNCTNGCVLDYPSASGSDEGQILETECF